MGGQSYDVSAFSIMPYNVSTSSFDLTPEMERLKREKESGRKLQERKHSDWTENYELYRNKVKTNRLTQRQAVNIPIMKETIKTMASRIDDPPAVDWKELSSDEQKELIYQEIWNEQVKKNKLNLIDALDKKNVLMYGLSTKKLNISKEGVLISVLDPYDILFDPLKTPWDLESARFIIHQNIFRPAREIIADDKYSQKGRDELKIWIDSVPGITHGSVNKEEWEKKMKRLESMGVTSSDFGLFAGGDRIINLTEHYTNVWSNKTKKFEKRVVVYADDCIELLDETLDELIGVDFWPFVMWSEDVELSDGYPDSIADLIRTPNKVLNVWYSQLIENRTLKNFQMHWYSPSDGYTAQTYTPGPGLMIPAPPSATGRISDVIQPVEISGLDDTLLAVEAVTKIIERGTGATAIDKGQSEQGQQTLGEIEILVGKANERVTAMAKFYRMAWYELAWKWDKLMHANAPKFMKLYKVGRSGKTYQKRIFINDWKSEAGYEPTVSSTSEQEQESVKGLQKFGYVMAQFPNNTALRKISQKRQLEMLDLTPEELKQVEDAEEEAEKMAVMAPQAPVEAPQPQLMGDIQKQMQQLQV